MLADSSFDEHRFGCLIAPASRFFRREFVEAVPEYFHTDGIVVPNLLKSVQKADQIDDAFSRQEPLIVADLFRREVGGVAEMHVNDSLTPSIDNVLDGGSSVVPMPDVKQQTHVRAAFLGELQHVVHSPNELMRELVPEVNGA